MVKNSGKSMVPLPVNKKNVVPFKIWGGGGGGGGGGYFMTKLYYWPLKSHENLIDRKYGDTRLTHWMSSF